MLDEVVII